jgi:hypothetical protein
VEDLREVMLEEAFPYQEVGIWISVKDRFDCKKTYPGKGGGIPIGGNPGMPGGGGWKGLAPGF